IESACVTVTSEARCDPPRGSRLFLCVMRRPALTSTLFPYTTLFRSGREGMTQHGGSDGHVQQAQPAAHRSQSFVDIAIRLLDMRSEEHTSELQSLRHLVCRLLLEKKKD